jgi:hypothetical protein
MASGTEPTEPAFFTIRCLWNATDTVCVGGELSLTCPHCGQRFPSAMQPDAETFSKMRVHRLVECCRACGHTSRFEKSDYYYSADPNEPERT